MLRITLLFLSMMLCAAPSAFAGDVQGTWVVDLEASDSLDPLLEAQGVSWAKRKLANSVEVTQTYVRKGAQVTLDVKSPVGTRTETLTTDGKLRSVTTELGKMQVSHRWDGEVLVTKQVRETKAGQLTVTVRREVSADGKTMTLRMTLERPDEKRVVVRRVFRKTKS